MTEPSILYVSSEDRVSGNLDAFRVVLNRSLARATRVSLLYANIANPIDAAAEMAWLISVPELGLPVATCGGRSATFVIPVNAAQGFRTLHRGGSDFGAVALQSPAAAITELSVSIHTASGEPPGLTAEWLLVLGVHYD